MPEGHRQGRCKLEDWKFPFGPHWWRGKCGMWGTSSQKNASAAFPKQETELHIGQAIKAYYNIISDKQESMVSVKRTEITGL